MFPVEGFRHGFLPMVDHPARHLFVTQDGNSSFELKGTQQGGHNRRHCRLVKIPCGFPSVSSKESNSCARRDRGRERERERGVCENDGTWCLVTICPCLSRSAFVETINLILRRLRRSMSAGTDGASRSLFQCHNSFPSSSPPRLRLLGTMTIAVAIFRFGHTYRFRLLDLSVQAFGFGKSASRLSRTGCRKG